MKKIISISILFVLLVAGGALLYGKNPLVQSKPVMVRIEAAQTGAEIAQILADKNIIWNPHIFRAALYLSGNVDKLQEGHYDLMTNMSMPAVIAALRDGRPAARQVVIPEGFTVSQIAKRLDRLGIAKKHDFLEAAKVYSLPADMQSTRATDYPVEGFLFPSTYDVPDGASVNDIIAHMNREMQKQLTPELRQEITAQGFSLHDFITLASLVEKEAMYEDDRYTIAAVFKKRLAIGMPLQSCASIQYILGEPKPVLSIADTQIPSPYNTYLHKGLPPGPVAAPGKAAMDAVLHAPTTEYLYFVADAKGYHHFAKTYEEHEANIDRYAASQ